MLCTTTTNIPHLIYGASFCYPISIKISNFPYAKRPVRATGQGIGLVNQLNFLVAQGNFFTVMS